METSDSRKQRLIDQEQLKIRNRSEDQGKDKE